MNERLIAQLEEVDPIIIHTELEEEFICPCEVCSNQSPKED